MIKQLLIVSVLASFCGAHAQTNAVHQENGAPQELERSKKEREGYGKGRERDRRREMTPEMKKQMDERRLQFMQKTLKDIGVTEEQKVEIAAIQAKMQAELHANTQAVGAARDHISKLQTSNATQEELFSAIDVLSAAQGEKMKILVRNQMDMKRVLGEEKYNLFMDSARLQWREHGRRGGGPGLPPRPGLPPMPGQGAEKEPPPLPSDP